MKKLLTLLGSISMIGTAGATVVACGDTKTKEEAPSVSKQNLLDLIEQASNLKGANPNPEAEGQLKIAIDSAQKVANDDTATQAQVDQTVESLKKAIEDFKNQTATDYSELQDALDDAKYEIENAPEPNANTEKLQAEIDKAQAVRDNPEATQVQVDEAKDTLIEAIVGFWESQE